MVKRILAVIAISLFICGVVYAADLNFTFKQGMLYLHNDRQAKNFSCLELVKTKPKEEWGKWNMLWDGWSLDGGVSYDGAGMNSMALMLGRNFGTLAKYLPLDYPLLKKLTITLYPYGISAKYPLDNIELQGASGVSYLTIGGKF